jgi:hypothetical protein
MGRPVVRSTQLPSGVPAHLRARSSAVTGHRVSRVRQRSTWVITGVVLLVIGGVALLSRGLFTDTSSDAPSPQSTASPPVPVVTDRVYGTLESSPDRLEEITAAGVDLVTFHVQWSRFAPVEGEIDQDYLAELRDTLAAYRQADVEVVLSTGVHHPPDWVLDRPHSRFVNQHGEPYAPRESGKRIANMVFNGAMRDQQAAYLGQLFTEFGTDFHGVRLGGGWYGSVTYPDPVDEDRTNSYWGFDAIALGEVDGLPAGMTANPVPDWTPGTPSADDEAERFVEWYLDSLRHYHDWQIATVREHYDGRLLMVYPSWGIRPGQLEEAIAGDLDGTTSVERNGEVQRGFDFARFIGGIDDPGVVVYTTWLDAEPEADDTDDQRYWTPVKYLAHLARDRERPLEVVGQNSGSDGPDVLELTFDQADEHGLDAIVWAFERELFDGRHATIDDLAAEIEEDPAA